MKDIDNSGNEVGDDGAEWRLITTHSNGDYCYQYFSSSTATEPVFGNANGINDYCSIKWSNGVWIPDFNGSSAFSGSSDPSLWRIIDSSVGTYVKEVQYWWGNTWNPIATGFSRFRDPFKKTLSSTGGSWGAISYEVLSTDTTNGWYVYGYNAQLTQHYFGYKWSTDEWVDIGSDDPASFVITISGDTRTVQGWRSPSSQWNTVSGVADKVFEFIDPYYTS